MCLVLIAWAPRVRLAAHNPITTKVTWTREISTLLARRCVTCHRPGGYAGFPLTTFDEARPWAVAIKEVVLAGEMPPWGAAAGVGHFANDRRLTRHEQELIAAWVDGGAPYAPNARTPAFLDAGSAADAAKPLSEAKPADGIAIPLAPATIGAGGRRTASVTLQVPPETTLVGWTFEPGLAAHVASVDLELDSRWLGTWTPGDTRIDFPDDAGAPLSGAALFTAGIEYRAPDSAGVDQSRLRIWISKDARPKTIREATVVRSWRAPSSIEVIAIRPASEGREVHVVARFPNGGSEAVGALAPPSRGMPPTYILMRPLAMPAGARLETTSAVRLLYAAGATRTVKPNVRRRPRR